MTILTGTTKTQFPDFTDPNTGLGNLLSRLQQSTLKALSFISGTYENNFVEDGTQPVPGFTTIGESFSNIKQPNIRRITTQRPQVTVFIKKKQFSSLRNHYDIRYMNEKDKLFLRSVKALMDKKAQDLSYYEALINLEGIFRNDGFLNVDKITDTFTGAFFTGIQTFDPRFQNTPQQQLENIGITDPNLNPFYKWILQLKNLQTTNQRSKGNTLTTWITDPANPDLYGVGQGVGVIELNLVSRITTTVSCREVGGGGCTLEIEDPYRTMLITDADIEIALRQALAEKSNSLQANQFQFDQLLHRAQALDAQLNALRQARGVSQLNFEFQLGSDAILGVVVATGEQFTQFSTDALSDSLQSLDGSEAALASQIFFLLQEYKTAQQNVNVLFQTINQKYNDIRQRLRNEFVGHAIIQQMDVVSIFMNSRTRDSTPSYDGRLDEQTLLIGTLGKRTDLLAEETIEAERQTLAPDIPSWLYSAMRDRTVFRQDGNQIFMGPVDSVQMSYRADSGKFNISVSAKDNSTFLGLGKINTFPSLSQPGGILEDPLTPFSLKTDPGTGLIDATPTLSDENKARLSYLKFEDGPLAGKRVTDDLQLYQNKLLGGKVVTYQHVPGLIYSWKSGIITETLNVNIQRPLNGRGSTLSDVVDQYGVTSIDNPFAGLDVADVISILVTGRPHSYTTFLKHALDVGTFSIDNSNPSKLYFNYLFDFIERENSKFGDFVPAVKDTIDPIVANQLFQEKLKIQGFNGQLSRYLRDLASLQDQQRAGTNTSMAQSDLQTQIKETQDKVNALMVEGNTIAADRQVNFSFGAIGNQVNLQFTPDQQQDIDYKLRYQLRRKAEDVRYNLDQNYLVVSSKYDSDTDIQAFTANLKNPELFNSEYKSVLDQCRDAAKTVGFEFFADSQGNLVFRPPEYNKTPLTLILRLLQLSRAEQITLMPDYLQSLFKTRLEVVKNSILETELKVVDDLILLGEISSIGEISFAGQILGTTLSIKLGDDGQSWNLDEQTLLTILTADTLLPIDRQQALITNTALSNKIDPKSQVQLLATVRNAEANAQGTPTVSLEDPTVLEKLTNELAQYDLSVAPSATLNRLNLTNDIALKLSQRALFGKTYKALINTFKGFNLDPNQLLQRSDSTPPSAVASTTADQPVIPKLLVDLIEDDTKNEDGFKSGRRYIINDDVIISMDFSVQSPEITRIDVTGAQNFLGSSQGGNLGSLPKVMWAGAVDFDMWRQFGYRSAQDIHRPDFTDAELQCAPYAVFKLQAERRRIHQGSVTVIGNEFYQAGDVVYINNKNMLYYVESVQHNFSFDNGNYTTILKLTYGRALGEYIPTPLDVIGKGELGTRKNAFSNLKANRSSVSFSHVVPLETLFVPNYLNVDPTDSGDIQTRGRDFTEDKNNQEKITRAVRKAASRITSGNTGDIAIEVRTYFISESSLPPEQRKSASIAKIFGPFVVKMLTTSLQTDTQQALVNGKLNATSVLLADPIEITKDSELSDRDQQLRRFPTSTAWAGAITSITSDAVSVPVNAIDIVFLTEQSIYGDQPAVKIRNV